MIYFQLNKYFCDDLKILEYAPEKRFCIFVSRKMTFSWFCCQILFVVWKCSLENWSSNKSKNYYSSLNHWRLLSSTTSLPIWNGRREDNLITSTNVKSTELSWSILVPITILHNSSSLPTSSILALLVTSVETFGIGRIPDRMIPHWVGFASLTWEKFQHKYAQYGRNRWTLTDVFGKHELKCLDRSYSIHFYYNPDRHPAREINIESPASRTRMVHPVQRFELFFKLISIT